MRRLSGLLILVLLAGCASVPLGTMWKLRSFDADTLVQLDPAELRAAVALIPVHPIRPDSVHLGLVLARQDGKQETYSFALVPTREPGPSKAGWQYSTWELDAAGRREFALMQLALSKTGDDFKATYSGVTFDVKFKPEFGPKPPPSLRLSVQLRFTLADGYFLLVDDAEFPVTGADR